MATELPVEIYAQIQNLCSEGDALAENSRFTEAIQKYEEALNLVPSPISEWEAATWILTAIGDVQFHLRDFENAVRALLDAMKCPGAIGNPFIHLRLGQVQFELGFEALAKDELARAYMGGGKEIFEDDDPKYFKLVKESLKAPPSGW